MIKNIIFDFGDIFINLDKGVVFREMQKHGNNDLTPDLLALNNDFEIGHIEPETFVNGLRSSFPTISSQKTIDIWNSMLLDFPDYRLEFIESLANEGRYRLFLLSNTNALHIPHVVKIIGRDKYNRFKSCFEKFYLSHQIHLRKPNADIYQFVLDENELNSTETFFVDDTLENTDAAKKLGITVWNLIVGKEDIIQLKSKL
ncbi:MAG: HAD family phosphatase [Maribacter sp.]|nr:HAD family phosphatase [Maribacter sp.]